MDFEMAHLRRRTLLGVNPDVTQYRGPAPGRLVGPTDLFIHFDPGARSLPDPSKGFLQIPKQKPDIFQPFHLTRLDSPAAAGLVIRELPDLMGQTTDLMV